MELAPSVSERRKKKKRTRVEIDQLGRRSVMRSTLHAITGSALRRSAMRAMSMGRVRRRPLTIVLARGEEILLGTVANSRVLATQTLSGARNGTVGSSLAESEFHADVPVATTARPSSIASLMMIRKWNCLLYTSPSPRD